MRTSGNGDPGSGLKTAVEGCQVPTWHPTTAVFRPDPSYHARMRWLLVALIAVSAYSQPARPRARDIGIAPGTLTPGPLNAITDVAGVRVGHITIIEGDTVRTGVTAI